MRSSCRSLLCALLFTALLVARISCTKFTVSNRQITVDGQRFFAKGVNYSPIPPGCDIDPAGGSGDMLTDDWAPIHDRDLEYLRGACINTIRVYNWVADLEDKISHHDFLDKAWNDGDHPVYVWITSAFAVDSWKIDPVGLQTNLRAIAHEYGSHDAVIGFVLGNELNNGDNKYDPEFWAFINGLGAIVREEAPDKLTIISVVDDSMETVTYAETRDLSNLDVWGINSYRGSTTSGFDILFSSFAELSDKPLIITEFGVPASTRNARDKVVLLPENAKLQADYMEVHYQDCLDNSNVCQGAFVFEWTDEWWKTGDVGSHDASPHTNEAFPGGWWDEEWFGMCGIEPVGPLDEYRTRGADILHPREVYYRYAEMPAIGYECEPDPIEDNDPPVYASTTGGEDPSTTGIVGDGGDPSDPEDSAASSLRWLW